MEQAGTAKRANIKQRIVEVIPGSSNHTLAQSMLIKSSVGASGGSCVLAYVDALGTISVNTAEENVTVLGTCSLPRLYSSNGHKIFGTVHE